METEKENYKEQFQIRDSRKINPTVLIIQQNMQLIMVIPKANTKTY